MRRFFFDFLLQKNKILLLGILLLLVACSKDESNQVSSTSPSTLPDKTPSIKGEKTPKNLAKRIFKLLQENNALEYQQLVLNFEDINYFSEVTMNHISKQKNSQESAEKIRQKIQKHLKSFPYRRKKNLKYITNSFRQTYKKTINAGANWKQLKLIGHHIENRHTRHGISKLTLYLNIKDSKRYYVIKIKDCMKVKRGWILTQGPIFEGVSQLNNPKHPPL